MKQHDCFVSEEEISAYIDRELDESRIEVLDKHLSLCDDCEIRHEVFLRLKSIVKDEACTEKAPAWLRERVSSALAEQGDKRPGMFWSTLIGLVRNRPLVPIGAVASLVVVLLIGLFSRSGGPATMPMVTDLVHEHFEYIEEKPGFGIVSNDLDEIFRWIASNSDLNCNIARHENLPPATGGCVIQEDDDKIGYVNFKYSDKQISLFIVDDSGTKLFGPREVVFRDIPVYCGNCTGMNYVMWHGQGVICVMIGDIPESSLVEFADMMI